MKRILILFSVVLLFVPAINQFAANNEKWMPVLMTRSQLDESIQLLAPKLLYKPGKIYKYLNYFFIVESYKGIHVINNTNPNQPIIEHFITIPGCVDLAIKNNIMYVDNAVDLVAIDISNLNKLVITKRIRDIFPELVHPDWQYIPYEFSKENRPENTIIVGWTKE